MKTLYLLIPVIFLCLSTTAQRNKDVNFAITNSSPAFPFSKFGGLFTKPYHPGAEIGYGFNWKTKKRHDWFQQVRLGYFYHRFVQHGIPLYTNFGYRYKFSPSFFAESSLGAGYLQSIPATAILKLNNNGEYENHKGIGRMQAMFVFNISAGYTFKTKPISIFTTYQQRVQTPFVKSYVPLLPYNNFQFGLKMALKSIHVRATKS